MNTLYNIHFTHNCSHISHPAPMEDNDLQTDCLKAQTVWASTNHSDNSPSFVRRPRHTDETCRFTVSAEKTKKTKRATSVRGKDSFDLLQVDVRRACQLVHVRRLSELFSAHLVSLYSTATTQQIRTSISRNGFTAVVDKCSRDGSITTRAILVRKKSNRQVLRRHLLPTAGPDGRFDDRVRKDGATARHRIVRLRGAATRNHAHSSKQVVELRQRNHTKHSKHAIHPPSTFMPCRVARMAYPTQHLIQLIRLHHLVRLHNIIYFTFLYFRYMLQTSYTALIQSTVDCRPTMAPHAGFSRSIAPGYGPSTTDGPI